MLSGALGEFFISKNVLQVLQTSTTNENVEKNKTVIKNRRITITELVEDLSGSG